MFPGPLPMACICIQLVKIRMTNSLTHKLAEHERLSFTLIIGKFNNLVDRWVHPRVHVHSLRVDVGFVMDWPAVIICLDVIVQRFEVLAEEGFITQAPYDNRRM